jgi:hypothetical protein
MLVLGGRHNYPQVCPGIPSGEWNDYESYTVGIDPLNQNKPTLIHDYIPGPTPTYVYCGPSTMVCGPPAPGRGPLADYPRTGLLTSGYASTSGFWLSASQVFHNPTAQPSWIIDRGTHPASVQHLYNSAVLFPNFGQTNDYTVRLGGFVVPGASPPAATASVEMLNAGGGAGTPWLSLTSMAYPRGFANAVILPNGQILVVGGCQTHDGTNPVLVPELYDITAGAGGTWYPMSQHAGNRQYHSTAVLLPDARVLVGGGEGRTYDYQIFRPPYLTLGFQRPQNVTLEWAPDPNQDYEYVMKYRPTGGTYEIRYDALSFPAYVAKVVLMRPCCCTHHSDMDQRYHELELTDGPGTEPPTRIYVRPPVSRLHAPPGFYMLFLVTNQGVPSVAKWIWLQD